jgi:hypothetical protein
VVVWLPAKRALGWFSWTGVILTGSQVRTEAGPLVPAVGPAEVRGFVTSFLVSVERLLRSEAGGCLKWADAFVEGADGFPEDVPPGGGWEPSLAT